MKAEYYHYRVEFQLRGAGHIHGVLWLDLPELEKSKKEYAGLQSIMAKLRNSCSLNQKERETLAHFVDDFVSCSLKEESLEKTVRAVQEHGHCGKPEDKS